MNNKEITRIDIVEGGSVIRQGHYFTMHLKPRNAKGETVDLTGKDIQVQLIGSRGIVHESAGRFANGEIIFDVQETLPHGDLWMEITATDPNDATYRQKFPSARDTRMIKMVRGADDLEVAGISMKTVKQFEAEQAAFKAEIKQEFDAAVGAITEDSEVVLARGEEPTLYQRLDKDKQELTVKLAEKVEVDLFNDNKDATGFLLSTIIKKYELEPMPEPILQKNLWEAADTVFGTLSETSGNVTTHASNETSDFIPVLSDENYSFFSALVTYKVVFYDASKVFISGYGWAGYNVPLTYLTPSNAAFMRITVQGNGVDDFVANIGTEPIDPNAEPTVYYSNFWEDVPTPPLRENSVKTHHYANKSVTAEKLTDEIAAFVSPTRKFYKNLWNANDTVPGTLNESSGNITDHASNRTTNPIAVKPGEKYTFYDTSYKLAFFNSSNAVVQGFGWTAIGENLTYTVPATAAYMRITVQQAFQDVFVVNIGETLMQPDQEGTIYTDSFWDAMPDGTIGKRLLSGELLSTLNEKRPESPFPQRLNFKEVYAGSREVLHLSRDGKVLYFKENAAVYQSVDDGETMQLVGTPSPAFATIQAVRELEDGELLVSTSRDDSTELKSKVYKTSGYSREDPTNTQFIEVMEAISSRANIYGSWGLEAHENICLASEYGLRDVDGARHVYLSTDYGDNWTMIFDQMTTTAEIEGAPTWTTSAHLHTVHYDRYWNRIWLVVGDNPNSATYYSDDLGVSWEHVPNSHVVQYTGIISYPDGVVFGSDRAPNGLHVWKRTDNKSDPVRIDTLETINDETVITHVFQRAFRRYSEKGELTLFPATRVSNFEGVYSSVIMGFTNINNPVLLYELDKTMPTPGLYNAVGVTDRGNILTSYYNGTSFVVVRAKAPVWE